VSTRPSEPEPAAEPAAVVRPRVRVSPIWLAPLLAAGLVVYLAVRSMSDRGLRVTITFETAEGLTAHQTEVKYKSVTVGTVETVSIGSDMSSVVVVARIDRSIKSLVTDHARFWVVRPRLTPATGPITGLETIVTGGYIEFDPGGPGGRPGRDFRGLEQPPGVRSGEPGRVFVLKAARLGPIGPTAPVFYRDASVGEVLSYDLGDGTGPVALRVFLRAPYDTFVHPGTRFWNASGLAVTTSASGVRVEIESLQSVLAGGVAFETPTERAVGPPAEENAVFELYDNKSAADADLFDESLPCVSYFQSSVAGLARGSTVEMFGVPIGVVTDVRLVFDPQGAAIARVAFRLQRQLLPTNSEAHVAPSTDSGPDRETLIHLVDSGLRVVPESDSLIMGPKGLSLKRVPGVKRRPVTLEGDALVLPGQPGALDDVGNELGEVVAKLNQIPYGEIAAHLDHALGSVDRTVSGPEMRQALVSLSQTLTDVRALVRDVDSGVGPALQRLPAISEEVEQAAQRANDAFGKGGYGASSDFQRNMGRLMSQLTDAARSIRLLAEFLDRHPEALLRGRGQGEK
jgi:paraquat-inducible protein B